MMTGASRDSLAASLEAVGPVLDEGGVALARELFGALDVVDEHGALRRALTDPAWTTERRHGLVDSLFGARVTPGALQVLKDLAGRRWSAERDLGDASRRWPRTRPPRMSTTECSCRLWPSPGM